MANVKIRSASNGKYLYAKTEESSSLIYVTGDVDNATVFSQNDDGSFSLTNDSSLFLSYRGTTGAVKLYNEATLYRVDPAQPAHKGNFTIYSKEAEDYMWNSDEEPYITGSGKSHIHDSLGWWTIEPA